MFYFSGQLQLAPIPIGAIKLYLKLAVQDLFPIQTSSQPVLIASEAGVPAKLVRTLQSRWSSTISTSQGTLLEGCVPQSLPSKNSPVYDSALVPRQRRGFAPYNWTVQLTRFRSIHQLRDAFQKKKSSYKGTLSLSPFTPSLPRK